MADNQSAYAPMLPLTTSSQTAVRWVISAACAHGLVLLLLTLLFNSEPDIAVLTPPLLYLDYVVLQPKKITAPPKIPKRKPIPKETEEPVVQPKAEAPVAPSEQIAAPAEIMATPAPAKKKPQVVRILSTADLDNTDFNPLYNPKPKYPLVALRNDIEGYVDVDLIITEKGRVDKISLVEVSGHPSFRGSVVKAVAKWRFPPPRLKGKKVRVKYVYRVNFTLH